MCMCVSKKKKKKVVTAQNELHTHARLHTHRCLTLPGKRGKGRRNRKRLSSARFRFFPPRERDVYSIKQEGEVKEGKFCSFKLKIASMTSALSPTELSLLKRGK